MKKKKKKTRNGMLVSKVWLGYTSKALLVSFSLLFFGYCCINEFVCVCVCVYVYIYVDVVRICFCNIVTIIFFIFYF